VAEVHRVRAELQLAMDSDRTSRARAETDLRTAIAVARQQGAYRLALRAAVSLGRMLAETGRTGEAGVVVRTAVHEIDGAVDQPDLRIAQSLLKRLQS
jgi:hypothetical protein